MATKWEILISRAAEAKAAYELAMHQLKVLENTPCELSCDCGAYFPMESDFAKHFTIPDTRYLNLGDCPILDRDK